MTTFDRRRTNPPASGTSAPRFCPTLLSGTPIPLPVRSRAADEVQKIFLQTNMTPSASGSAYLELSPSSSSPAHTSSPTARPSTLKLSCTIHGPRPLPRTAPYSATLQLSASVKFAPFASRQRRGYLRDAAERDLGVQLEAALGACVLGARWPKSGADVIVTVLEGAEERLDVEGAPTAWTEGAFAEGSYARMQVLAGCISVAGAALACSGIDCVDLVSGGVAALVMHEGKEEQPALVLDPNFTEHAPRTIAAACCVAYLKSRDEVAGLWTVGEIPVSDDSQIKSASEHQTGKEKALWEDLLDGAVRAASLGGQVVRAAVMGET